MLEVTSVNEIEATISRKKEFFREYSLKIQPYIIKLQNENGDCYLVCLDNIKFMFNNFLASFDCCFHIFHVLNLQYTFECEFFWIFIEKIFYDLNLNSNLDSEGIVLKKYLETNAVN